MERKFPFIGLTLIELLVVLVIISLVAATATVTMSGMWREASLEASVTRLESLDQHMRSFAQTHGKSCSLEFDTAAQQVRKNYHVGKRSDQSASSIGRGLKIERVLLKGTSTTRRQVSVPFDHIGTTPTYALEFRKSTGQSFWLLFAGVTGQLTRIDKQEDLNAILKLLTP